MKKLLAPLVVLLGATSAFAQSDTGVTTSTDPARAEAVERHAQMLQQQARPEPMAPGSSSKGHGHHEMHHEMHHEKHHEMHHEKQQPKKS